MGKTVVQFLMCLVRFFFVSIALPQLPQVNCFFCGNKILYHTCISVKQRRKRKSPVKSVHNICKEQVISLIYICFKELK